VACPPPTHTVVIEHVVIILQRVSDLCDALPEVYVRTNSASEECAVNKCASKSGRGWCRVVKAHESPHTASAHSYAREHAAALIGRECVCLSIFSSPNVSLELRLPSCARAFVH
jgi:hypothetical protein